MAGSKGSVQEPSGPVGLGRPVWPPLYFWEQLGRLLSSVGPGFAVWKVHRHPLPSPATSQVRTATAWRLRVWCRSLVYMVKLGWGLRAPLRVSHGYV